MADDYLVEIPSFVCGAPAPTPFSSALPILLGATLQGGSLVVCIPGVEPRQLYTERRVDLTRLYYLHRSTPPPRFVRLGPKHSKLQEN